jgi:hypothetical protein
VGDASTADRDKRRTALVLASIALLFFFGVMLKYVVFQ